MNKKWEWVYRKEKILLFIFFIFVFQGIYNNDEDEYNEQGVLSVSARSMRLKLHEQAIYIYTLVLCI